MVPVYKSISLSKEMTPINKNKGLTVGSLDAILYIADPRRLIATGSDIWYVWLYLTVKLESAVICNDKKETSVRIGENVEKHKGNFDLRKS